MFSPKTKIKKKNNKTSKFLFKQLLWTYFSTSLKCWDYVTNNYLANGHTTFGHASHRPDHKTTPEFRVGCQARLSTSDQNIWFSRPDPEMKRPLIALSSNDFSPWFVLFLNLFRRWMSLVNVKITREINEHVRLSYFSKSYPIPDWKGKIYNPISD